jgi:hypothetical protein
MSEPTVIRLWAGDETPDDIDFSDAVDVTSDIAPREFGPFTADPMSVRMFVCRGCGERVVNPYGEDWFHADTGAVLCKAKRAA